MSFSYSTNSAQKIRHNSTSYDVDIQRFTSVCGKAKYMSMTHQQFFFSDSFPEPIFEMFIGLCTDKNIILDPHSAPTLLKLIQEYDAPTIIQELEKRILSTEDPNLIANFILSDPDHFQGLLSYVHLHLNAFQNTNQLFDLPLSSLLGGLPSQSPDSQMFSGDSRHYAEMFEATNNLKDQEKALDNEKAELDKQIAQIRAKTSQLDADNQKMSKLINETETDIEKLKAQVQEKKKMVSSLSSQLKQEGRLQTEAKKEADKAQNELNQAKSKLAQAKNEYDKLVH